jgi:regulator of sigma E protease
VVAEHDRHRAFNRQVLWKRSAIVIAGPLANFFLAIAVYWLVFVLGVQEPRALLGTPVKDSPAAAAGIRDGDEVLQVNAESIASWSGLRIAVLEHAGESIDMLVEGADGRRRQLQMATAALGEDLDADFSERLGLQLWRPDAVIAEVLPGEPAAKAGLRAGDRVYEVGAVAVNKWEEFVAQVERYPERSVVMKVERDGAALEILVTPKAVERNGRRVGMIGARFPSVLLRDVRYGPVEAIGAAVRKAVDTTVLTLKVLGKMVVGDASLNNLSGPVTIAVYAGRSAELGLAYYLDLMAVISLGLGIFNLLPVPILDGGHLLYHLAEFVRGGPLPERVLERAQQFGLAVLFALMMLALYNDFHRLLAG